MEAARIRAEAAALEAAAAESRRQARATRLTDGQSNVPARDLRKRLEEDVKLDFSLSEVKDLVGGMDPVTSEKLASEDFEVKLRMLVSAKVETTRALQSALEAEAAAPKIDVEEEIKSVFSSEVDGDDRTLGIRVLAALVYLLPLADGLQFGVPLLEFVPMALPFVKAFAILVSLKNMIPFGTFIFLILFQASARNAELPQLLRYNLAQAVVLDVLFIIPDFFMSIIQMELPVDLLMALFLILFGVMVYSITLTFLGRVPDGLGAVSDMTRRNLGRF